VSPRRYESTARAEAAQATRDRIVRAAIDLAYERGDLEMTLTQIADRAGTTVRTVMRQFGSREALIDAGSALAGAEVAAERGDPAGDRERSLHLLVEHYEKRGGFVLRLLASELPSAQRVTAAGRSQHRAWVEEVFADDLPAESPARDETVDLLVVATDVYAWKLLRLDRGLDVATTTDRIRTLTRRVLEGRTR
jgi:AcrR family transcriptional regulator